MGKYDSLTKEELLRLMEARDRREATRYGLVWETDGIEAEQALNGDYVALDLVPELCCGPPPWRNLVIEGDNFDALRALRPGFSGKVRCLATDPPYNTGNRDFLYNDRFIDKDDLWRHSKWLEFMLVQGSRNLQNSKICAPIYFDDHELLELFYPHMSEFRSNRKSDRAARIRTKAPEDVIRGFELLGLANTSPSEYRSSQEFAKRFTRCTRTKFTQVTYSGSSH